jgi:hypothetical protein
MFKKISQLLIDTIFMCFLYCAGFSITFFGFRINSIIERGLSDYEIMRYLNYMVFACTIAICHLIMFKIFEFRQKKN